MRIWRLDGEKKEIMMSNFRDGDTVEAFGHMGVVRTEVSINPLYPIEVTYKDEERIDHFTEDGKLYTWHKKPTLKLIERKRKKPKVQGLFHHEFGGFMSEETYDSYEEALNAAINHYQIGDRFQVVPSFRLVEA